MKFDINKWREMYPQMMFQTNKEYKKVCLDNFIEQTISSLQHIKDFTDFDVEQTLDYKKKIGEMKITFKLK